MFYLFLKFVFFINLVIILSIIIYEIFGMIALQRFIQNFLFFSLNYFFGIPAKRLYKLFIWFTKQQFFKNNLKKLKKFSNKIKFFNFKIPQFLLLWSPIAMFKKHFCCCGCVTNDEDSLEANYKRIQKYSRDFRKPREFMFTHPDYQNLPDYWEKYALVGYPTKTPDLEKIDFVRLSARRWKKINPEASAWSRFKARLADCDWSLDGWG